MTGSPERGDRIAQSLIVSPFQGNTLWGMPISQDVALGWIIAALQAAADPGSRRNDCHNAI
jgi:hypothetical protein